MPLPYLWLLRVYTIIEGLEQLNSSKFDSEDVSTKKIQEKLQKYRHVDQSDSKLNFIEQLILSLTNLARFVTQESYHSCLMAQDVAIEVVKGGVMYTLIDGSILGYSIFVQDNKHLIGKDKNSLLLFKKFEVST